MAVRCLVKQRTEFKKALIALYEVRHGLSAPTAQGDPGSDARETVFHARRVSNSSGPVNLPHEHHAAPNMRHLLIACHWLTNVPLRYPMPLSPTPLKHQWLVRLVNVQEPHQQPLAAAQSSAGT